MKGTNKQLKLILVSTPIGFLGSGKGGGVELTIISLMKGLISLGHKIILVAPKGSKVPFESENLEIRLIDGIDQPSWQHQKKTDPVLIPSNSVLPKLWEIVINLASQYDAVINFAYDWLPLWLTKTQRIKIFHLISMGNESLVMKEIITEISQLFPFQLAFHTKRQSKDYLLNIDPIIVGNGFDMENYVFNQNQNGPLGWAGRIAPEKGLEDAVKVANYLDEKLLVWGLMEDNEYATEIENKFGKGIVDWKGFLPTNEFQKQLGKCRAFINTPKWNEAYGNVIVEAMACGVPVIAYDLGGPGELIEDGYNGFLVQPNDIEGMIKAIQSVSKIKRRNCRDWFESKASNEVFAKRVESWINKGLNKNLLTDLPR
ncbi:glycosyltransferase [Prochlorococcus marinus]|uniref:Glycosyl transferase n=1 Tax=Prochlorococcus marinus XMU1408 TaxID=2213228 RepID=A0A318R1V8_PROMR|nr:glycosyltransferase [Prochlorococcus marinus]MBW3042415.1 glycosyl transferase [Prochlorococcus marinus str. XMU1408]PYE01147.1 glycosyl transferase [Prochlorococcus marinus XMU1408]